MSKTVVAIQLEFGFHEIKKYIHSGFAKKMAKQFDLVWFAIDKKNPIFHDYFQATGFPMVYYQDGDFNIQQTFTEQCNNLVRTAWMKQNDVGMFHNYKKVQRKGIKDFFLGNGLLKGFMEKIALNEVKTRYVHKKLMEDFRRYHVQMVFSTGCDSGFAKCFYSSAHQAGLPCNYLVNSWKDLYINNFIPFSFLKNAFVWDEDMKKKYLHHMPYLSEQSLIVTGNPTFDVLMNYRPSKARAYYAGKYQLTETAQWFLYTMMPPGLVNDEIETIKKVAMELQKKYSSQQMELLIRKNPNHQFDDFLWENLPSNTHLAEHFCSFDPVSDMIVQTNEGEIEWLDLLFHCSVNLSVPSTVTMEFLTMSKPVINIEFNQSGQRDERVTQHFNSGFYRDLFYRDDIFRVSQIDELLSVVEKTLHRKIVSDRGSKSAAENIITTIS